MTAIILPLLLLGGCAHGAPPEENTGDGIVFLHLRVTPTSVVVVEKNVTPGRLKSLRVAPERPGLHFELEDAAGDVLWHGYTEDPFTVGIEHADPDGVIGRHAITRTEAEIVVRAPDDPRARSLVLFLVAAAETDRLERRLLGRIDLP